MEEKGSAADLDLNIHVAEQNCTYLEKYDFLFDETNRVKFLTTNILVLILLHNSLFNKQNNIQNVFFLEIKHIYDIISLILKTKLLKKVVAFNMM